MPSGRMTARIRTSRCRAKRVRRRSRLAAKKLKYLKTNSTPRLTATLVTRMALRRAAGPTAPGAVGRGCALRARGGLEARGGGAKSVVLRGGEEHRAEEAPAPGAVKDVARA